MSERSRIVGLSASLVLVVVILSLGVLGESSAVVARKQVTRPSPIIVATFVPNRSGDVQSFLSDDETTLDMLRNGWGMKMDYQHHEALVQWCDPTTRRKAEALAHRLSDSRLFSNFEVRRGATIAC